MLPADDTNNALCQQLGRRGYEDVYGTYLRAHVPRWIIPRDAYEPPRGSPTPPGMLFGSMVMLKFELLSVGWRVKKFLSSA